MVKLKTNLKPILITGSHRSGSTWVGRMIDNSPLVGYINEPFRVDCRPGICKASFEYWFTYICDQNAALYQDDLALSLAFQYQLSAELKAIRNPQDIARLLRDYFLFTNHRIFQKRPLMKDPIAVFSAEWLVKEFNMDAIILIRHPAAFVGSLKKANWSHQFSHFMKQPLLMKHHLDEFQEQIAEFAQEKKNIVNQGILLWNLTHYMILKYQEKYPNWLFIRHEDISINPIEEFAKIFHYLHLPYTSKIKKKITQFSSNNNSIETHNPLNIKRNSKANIKSWKNRLTQAEIELIRDKTSMISNRFYSESDWS